MITAKPKSTFRINTLKSSRMSEIKVTNTARSASKTPTSLFNIKTLQSKSRPSSQFHQNMVFIQPQKVFKEDAESFDNIIKTQYDDQMQSKLYFYKNKEFKHKCKTPFYLRQEKIQQFIYDKKLQNKLKYSTQSRINQTALPVPNGSVSIMLNVGKKEFGFQLQAFKKRIPARSKFKMKWKTIQWLLNNRGDTINQIFKNYNVLKKFAKNKKQGMNREEFGILLSYVGLGADQNLADKLFQQKMDFLMLFQSVFDEDGSGRVDYKELIVGLEVLKDDTLEEKLKIFFDLCDEDDSGKVSEREIYNVLKQNIINSNDLQKLKSSIRQIMKEMDKNGDGELDKKEFFEAARQNFTLRQLLEETFNNVKRIDDIIENDLEEPFHQFIPVSANFVNFKSGIHFPSVDNLLLALEQIETIETKTKQLKNTQTRFQKKQVQTLYGGLQDKIAQNDDSACYD